MATTPPSGGRARPAPARRHGLVTGSRATALVAAAVLVLCGCSTDHGPSGPSAADRAAAVARSAPSAPPQPAATVANVAPGTVTVAEGAFTDRLRLEDLALADGAVTGSLSITSDVSELIALEVQVDSYDAAGALVASERQVVDPGAAEDHHTTAGTRGLPLSVPAPGAASAVLSVPVLVNE